MKTGGRKTLESTAGSDRSVNEKNIPAQARQFVAALDRMMAPEYRSTLAWQKKRAWPNLTTDELEDIILETLIKIRGQAVAGYAFKKSPFSVVLGAIYYNAYDLAKKNDLEKGYRDHLADNLQKGLANSYRFEDEVLERIDVGMDTSPNIVLARSNDDTMLNTDYWEPALEDLIQDYRYLIETGKRKPPMRAFLLAHLDFVQEGRLVGFFEHKIPDADYQQQIQEVYGLKVAITYIPMLRKRGLEWLELQAVNDGLIEQPLVTIEKPSKNTENIEA